MLSMCFCFFRRSSCNSYGCVKSSAFGVWPANIVFVCLEYYNWCTKCVTIKLDNYNSSTSECNRKPHRKQCLKFIKLYRIQWERNNSKQLDNPGNPHHYLGPNQSNVTASAGQPNTTENALTTQSATSSTLNISSTALTSTDNSTRSSNGSDAPNTTLVTKSTAITSTAVTQNSSASFNESRGRSEHNLALIM